VAWSELGVNDLAAAHPYEIIKKYLAFLVRFL
jgi:hypothetical protein